MSINNLKFFVDGKYDVKLYEHVVELCQMVLETTNTMAQFPMEDVARVTHKYRATGLGMANLGTLLMEMGLPYGSDEARGVAATLMSVMTAQSYVTSAKMAQELGPFAGWSECYRGMLRVIRNHRRVAYKIHDDVDKKTHEDLGDYEGLVVKPHITIPCTLSWFSDVEKESRLLWDMALSLGGSYGFRNSVLTACAPTGTVSFIMGCETTGIEPCYALVTYKTLSGGGTMKLVVPSVERALRNMGYKTDDIKRAAEHIEKNGTLYNCDFIRPNHRDVFKCAASSRTDDTIHWRDHVLMTAALQPFVSGGISKTINMPDNVTEEQIMEAYELAYNTGCKGITVYRDGCKAAAPLSVKKDKTEAKKQRTEPVTETYDTTWGHRRHPSEIMSGFRHKIIIGSTRGYVEIFTYEDKRIAEVFITFGNPGSPLNNVLECWAIAFSVALQRGEPLFKMCSKFIGVEFEPKGFTGRRDDIKKVSSPIDYVVRLLLKLFDENGVLKKNALSDEKQHRDSAVVEQKRSEVVNISSRPMCPQCGSFMTGGSSKCPACEKCGFFGGCGG
jgi:ribonucleoside-diphosphate reductase alpha chain